jgi:hypothetical protein
MERVAGLILDADNLASRGRRFLLVRYGIFRAGQFT